MTDKKQKLSLTVRYLSKFSNQDWDHFNSFCLSSFNLNSVDKLIIKWLFTHKSEIDRTYSNAEIYKNLTIKIKRHAFTKSMSNIAKNIEEYFIWIEVKSNANLCQIYKSKALARRGYIEEFYQFKKKIKTNNEQEIDIWSDLYKMQIAYNEYFYHLDEKSKNSIVSFKEYLLHLNNFLNKICQFTSLELHNRSKILKEDWEIEISSVAEFADEESSLSSVYTNLLNLINNENANYKFLYSTLENKSYSLNIRFTILTHLISHLQRNIKTVNTEVKPKDILDLYLLGLNEDIIINSKHLPIKYFTNIIGTACKFGKIKWTQSFIKNWSKKVDNKNYKLVEILGEAYIAFYQKRYLDVIKMLARFKLDNHEITFRARWLYLAANFEDSPDEKELLIALIKSFNSFVSKKDITLSKSIITSVKNSLQILNLLTYPFYKSKIDLIIQKNPSLFNRVWILDKVKSKKAQNKLG